MANDPYSPLMPEQERGNKSALVIVVIVIILLLIGGLYAINSQQEEEITATTASSTNIQEEELSNSTELEDIDQDLNRLEAESSLEAEFGQFDQEARSL